PVSSLAPKQALRLLLAIPVCMSFSVSLFLLIVYFNKQECPKKSGYLKTHGIGFALDFCALLFGSRLNIYRRSNRAHRKYLYDLPPCAKF
ncbi:hypothetical protein ACO0LL_30195, partial [Undibacterium sp. TC4M20W]|uniref:hypothetical protein n=1 Tax=Undibacterium sp. TC4M20W TaxID=3413052 RepID=UPI003BF07EBF